MPRTHTPRRHAPGIALLRTALTRLLALALAAGLLAPAPAAAAPEEAGPILSLPTPPGESWVVLQGYACGSHNAWDRYSLDLVNADGRTYDAPVRAAADGVVFVWVRRSGTLILDHGGGFYTMYTHMARAEVAEPGRAVRRGDVIGAVGDRGAPGTPHLHFTAFNADGAWARNRRSVPLAFAEGYALPEIGGCSQHGGTVLVAGGAPSGDTTPPTVAPIPEPLQVHAGAPSPLAWPAGSDDGSGIAGYRVYIGPDPQGASEWFVPAPELDTPALAPGTYLLRLQPLDNAGNAGAWVTVATIIAAP